MKLSELIADLQELEKEFGGQIPVVIADGWRKYTFVENADLRGCAFDGQKLTDPPLEPDLYTIEIY